MWLRLGCFLQNLKNKKCVSRLQKKEKKTKKKTWGKWIMYTLLLCASGGADGDLQDTGLRWGRSWSCPELSAGACLNRVLSHHHSSPGDVSHRLGDLPAPLLCSSSSTEPASQVWRSVMLPGCWSDAQFLPQHSRVATALPQPSVPTPSTHTGCSSLPWGGSGSLPGIQSPLPEGDEGVVLVCTGQELAGTCSSLPDQADECWLVGGKLELVLGEKVRRGGKAKTWRGNKKSSEILDLFHSWFSHFTKAATKLQPYSSKCLSRQALQTDGGPPSTHGIPRAPGAAGPFASPLQPAGHALQPCTCSL